MGCYFLDASALTKRYLEERGTPTVLEISNSGARLIVSRLTAVEVVSAACRRARNGDINSDLLADILRAVDEDFTQLLEVTELVAATMSRSLNVAQAHALRASDSIQLACALSACDATKDKDAEVLFVCSDTELNIAAEAEGFQVFDPSRV
jgi:uncharacterized protein